MDSTFDSHNDIAGSESAKSSWEHVREIFSASSGTAAWDSFKNLIESTPTWALVVAGLGVATIVTNPWLISFAMGAGAFLTASYFTTKHAIRAAMQEHDQQRR